MAKYIDLQFSCPPSLDFPTYVGTQDEEGQPVQVGQWIKPSADNPFWILRLIPAELLMYLISDGQPVQVVTERHVRRNPPLVDDMPSGLLPTLSPRAALKAKLANAKPKQITDRYIPAADPLLTDKCPNPTCGRMFNPQTHPLLDCPTCGEDKCTLNCFGSTAEPCKDCLALVADPEEGGYEAPVAEVAQIKTPELRKAMADEARGAAAAVGSRLFDGIHHGKGGQDSEPADDDE